MGFIVTRSVSEGTPYRSLADASGYERAAILREIALMDPLPNPQPLTACFPSPRIGRNLFRGMVSLKLRGSISRILAKAFALEQLTDTLLSWQVHPARERWKASLASAAVIGIAGWLAAELMEHAGWGLFAAAVLIVGLNRFFFPTTYELTEEGITANYPLKTVHYPWRELRRFVYDRAGGFLSPRARRSLLDEYRGISLLFGEVNCCSESPSDPSPLTLTHSPEGRGDKTACEGESSFAGPLTLSPEGRGDKAGPTSRFG